MDEENDEFAFGFDYFLLLEEISSAVHYFFQGDGRVVKDSKLLVWCGSAHCIKIFV